MSWSIEGSNDKLSFHLSEAGFWSINGTALSHEARPVVGDLNVEFFAELNEIECSWGIHSCEEQEHEIALYGNELLKQVKKEPTRSHGVIRYFEEEPAVGVAIVLPERTLNEVRHLFELVLLNGDLHYLISVEFDGFREEGRDIDVPTIKAFKTGAEYHFHDISFSMLCRKSA